MKLRSAPKVYGEGIHRVIGPEETLRKVQRSLPRIGVTRLANITGLDRVGIPTYSAVVPKSNDVLSVYNGKGVSLVDAKVGAIMEAAERHAALELEVETTSGRFEDIRRSYEAIDPQALGLELHASYSGETVLRWMPGHDLLVDRPVLVPVDAVGYNLLGRYGGPCCAYSSTNGLASGNSVEEAICHALCELIERDAWTIADILARWLPRARREAAVGPGKRITRGSDDMERYPCLDLETLDPTARTLVDRFRQAGLAPMLRDLTSDVGVATVFASVTEEVGPEFPTAHFGLGTHPDARVAAIRALTEVAQSRAVDIQGVREDFSPADAVAHQFMGHTKRVSRINKECWYQGESTTRRPFRHIPSYVHSDVLEDITFMLGRIREVAAGPVIAVVITHGDVGIPVVRVLAPGLESWTADKGKLGARALRHWRENAAASTTPTLPELA